MNTYPSISPPSCSTSLPAAAADPPIYHQISISSLFHSTLYRTHQ
jgi:hypothetical protein